MNQRSLSGVRIFYVSAVLDLDAATFRSEDSGGITDMKDMKYLISVLVGAMSYGILSTIVVLAYGQGYKLGEVVGTQLLTGCILAWLLALYTKLRANRKQRSTANVTAPAKAAPTRLTWKHRLLLMMAGAPTVVTGLLYYQSLRYIPASLAIILLFQFTWISVLIQAVSKRQRPDKITVLTLILLFGGTLLAAGILNQGAAEFNLLGLLLGLLSAVSYSMFIIFSGKAVPSAIRPTGAPGWSLAAWCCCVSCSRRPSCLTVCYGDRCCCSASCWACSAPLSRRCCSPSGFRISAEGWPVFWAPSNCLWLS